MNNNLFRIVLLLGTLAIISIVVVQSYWLIKAWDIKDQAFDLSVQIALKRSALEVAKYNEVTLPKENLINRRSSNIYAVNVNSPVDPIVLENILFQELRNVSLLTTFEYAIYDCESDALVYGNYCEIEEINRTKVTSKISKFEQLNQYFVIVFPDRQSFLISNFTTNILLAFLAVFSVLVFTSFIFIFLRQRKESNLQQDFINNMTHEFKTPITSIKLALNSLKNQYEENKNPKIERYLSIIENQNNRLNNQIENVLQIARLEVYSKDSIKKQAVNIIDITKELIEEFKLSYPSYIIEFNSNVPYLKIDTDPIHLNNILSTLLDNAIKYSNDKKEISINIKHQNKTCEIQISDKGIGIAKENQSKVFEKFYRVEMGNRHDVKGFGLGLHYVKTICKLLKWSLKIESEINQGTKVFIKIPII